MDHRHPPDATWSAGPQRPGGLISETIDQLRLTSRGFLEVDKLMAVLGVDYPQDQIARTETIRRVTSKCIRASYVLARYTPGKVVKKVQEAGYPNFRMHDHTTLWKQREARQEGSGYGCFDRKGNWRWFEKWVDEVLAHCAASGEQYL